MDLGCSEGTSAGGCGHSRLIMAGVVILVLGVVASVSIFGGGRHACEAGGCDGGECDPGTAEDAMVWIGGGGDGPACCCPGVEELDSSRAF